MLAVRLLEGVNVLAACIDCSMCGGSEACMYIYIYIYIRYGSTYVYMDAMNEPYTNYERSGMI